MSTRLVKTPAPQRPALDRLIAAAREHPMAPEQEDEQRRSFVLGNIALSNPSVTRQMVDEVAQSCIENTGCSLVSGAETQATTWNRLGDWMQTFTGRAAYPLDLRPADIDIRDIAHALSMQCRYAGHCLRFYSVAEHSVHVARWLRSRYDHDVALEGLLHDASEAYLVDVPRPLKPFLLGYGDAERKAESVIAKRFGLSRIDFPAAVREADNRILTDERAQNMAPCEREWSGMREPLGIVLQFWSPERAESEFLSLFDELYGEDW